MLSIVLTAALILPGPLQDEERTPPDPAKVDAAVAALEKAFKSKEPLDRVQAIQSASEVVHARVIDEIVRGFKDKEDTVKEATIEALRWMDHPDALEALHKSYKKDKKLADDDELFTSLLRAIGQHGSTESIDVLADNPFKNTHGPAIKARILGLGNIRSDDSVEELFGMLQKVGKAKTHGVMTEFRLALMVLTGVDQGENREAWLKWWNDNKKTYEVSARPPKLPEKWQRRWDRYWGLDHVESRGERREDRGDDPEEG